MRMKEWTTTKLKKELDIWFSRYIRLRDKGQCYTCPKKDEPKKCNVVILIQDNIYLLGGMKEIITVNAMRAICYTMGNQVDMLNI